MEDKKNALGGRAMALAIIVLGWVLCAFLVFRSTQLNTGTADLCKIIFGISCDKALSSNFSWQLGYPLAGWGMVYFGLIGLLFSIRNQVADYVIILVVALGLGISGILTAIILRTNLYCPVCLSIHFINLLLLIALCINIRPTIYFRSQNPIPARRSYFPLGALLLLSIFIGGFSEVAILRSTFDKEAPVDLNEIANKFYKEKTFNFIKSDSSPYLGSIKAPIHLVVFSSFQCPACKGFAPSIESIQKKFGEKVVITFKNFPLSSTCNPGMSYDMQPRSCEAAYAALAAHRQNRFWNYHDRVFESDLAADEKSLITIAKDLGLNLEKWELDRQSDEVKKQVFNDLKVAYEIGINATPSVFINGRQVRNFNESVLNFIIQKELDKASLD